MIDKEFVWDDMAELPECSEPEELEEKADAVFAHLLKSACQEMRVYFE